MLLKNRKMKIRIRGGFCEPGNLVRARNNFYLHNISFEGKRIEEMLVRVGWPLVFLGKRFERFCDVYYFLMSGQVVGASHDEKDDWSDFLTVI